MAINHREIGLIARVPVQIPIRCDPLHFQIQRMNPSVVWHGKGSPIPTCPYQVVTCGFHCRFQSGHHRLGAIPDAYYRLDNLIWRGSEADALRPGSLPEQLTPPWKVSKLVMESIQARLKRIVLCRSHY